MANRTRQIREIHNIGVNELRKLFGKGRFATVTFTKKTDGTTRVLNGKTNVQRGLVGGDEAYDANSRGQLRVFDVNAKDKDGKRVGGYRTVTAQNVSKVTSGGIEYHVDNGEPVALFISSIIYNFRNNTLRLVIEGKIYLYFSVPNDVHIGLIEAVDKGSYFNRVIRNKYKYDRIA